MSTRMSRSCAHSPSRSLLRVTSRSTSIILASIVNELNDILRVIAELKRRFEPFLKSDDDSLIPADLLRTIFVHVSANIFTSNGLLTQDH